MLPEFPEEVGYLFPGKMSALDEVFADGFLDEHLVEQYGVYLELAQGVHPHRSLPDRFREFLARHEHPYLVLGEIAPAPGYVAEAGPLPSLPDNRLDEGLPWNDPRIVEELAEEKAALGYAPGMKIAPFAELVIGSVLLFPVHGGLALPERADPAVPVLAELDELPAGPIGLDKEVGASPLDLFVLHCNPVGMGFERFFPECI